MTLVFATGNRGKIREAAEILGEGYTLLTPDEVGIHEEIPEDGMTLRENALQKARYIYDKTGMDCFADDSGLEVDCLGGAPGVHTARYAGEERSAEKNMDKLLREIRRVVDDASAPAPRTARFRTSVALIRSGEIHFFEGVMEGSIALQRKGEGGFGYDPIFITEGYDLTNAQLGEAVKNRISHRGKALRSMAAYLRNENGNGK